MGLEFVVADLLAQDVDAIVNPANEQLAHGGGVAGLIARAAGPALQEASRRAAPLATGDAVATTAGALPQRYVIHAVGPVWRGGAHGEEELLASAHRRAVEVADELRLRSLALPAISTGIFGYPAERAAPVAVAATAQALARASSLVLVRFCFVDAGLCRVYAGATATACNGTAPDR